MRLLNWINSYEVTTQEKRIENNIDERYDIELDLNDEIFITKRKESNKVNDQNLIFRLKSEYYEYKNRDYRYHQNLDITLVESKMAKEERTKEQALAKNNLEAAFKNNETLIYNKISYREESIMSYPDYDSLNIDESINYIFHIYKLKTFNGTEKLLASGLNYDVVHNIYRQQVKWYFMSQSARPIYFDHRDYPDNVQLLGIDITNGKFTGSRKLYKIVREIV